MHGTGVWAETLAAMFHMARNQAGIPSTSPQLSTAAFRTATRQPGCSTAEAGQAGPAS